MDSLPAAGETSVHVSEVGACHWSWAAVPQPVVPAAGATVVTTSAAGAIGVFNLQLWGGSSLCPKTSCWGPELSVSELAAGVGPWSPGWGFHEGDAQGNLHTWRA